ncbi:hypothetical protein [Leptospira meyeri]|uniref:hypothetical protein n=1 Tax=Leptospira meyeri TaxID=29508 RepID=UPI0002BE079A|nr:hypothetical protein [Leptospira meyeri]EMJ86788.1 hypothetical protein LEP1GSC196_2982 [Leptospira meyeri serovar Semaranga str. Veldrot Semarang 173]
MTFSSMANDIISLVKPNGHNIENIKANVQPKTIFIFDEKIPLEEGDKIYRKLPNGLIESYVVLDRGYYSQFRGIQGHYQAKVRKENSISQEKYNSITNIYNATGINSRININSQDSSNNVYNSDEIFTSILQVIENIKEAEIQSKAKQLLEEMKSKKGTTSYLDCYIQFISLLSDHISLISAYIPPLTKLIVT